jgi:nicotinamidase-related amidase
MRKISWILTFALFVFFSPSSAQEKGSMDLPKDKTALLIIDVQEFYFPGGQVPLNHPEKTSEKIKTLLEAFREKEMEVIHIKHNASKNAAIHPNLAPLNNEKVFTKEEANSFNGTGLKKYLEDKQMTHLIITGMQTHMCVEATTRAAYDMGFKCIVPEETATTRELKYKDHIISAEDVHFSTLSSLQYSYARVVKLKDLLNSL